MNRVPIPTQATGQATRTDQTERRHYNTHSTPRRSRYNALGLTRQDRTDSSAWKNTCSRSSGSRAVRREPCAAQQHPHVVHHRGSARPGSIPDRTEQNRAEQNRTEHTALLACRFESDGPSNHPHTSTRVVCGVRRGVLPGLVSSANQYAPVVPCAECPLDAGLK